MVHKPGGPKRLIIGEASYSLRGVSAVKLQVSRAAGERLRAWGLLLVICSPLGIIGMLGPGTLRLDLFTAVLGFAIANLVAAGAHLMRRAREVPPDCTVLLIRDDGPVTVLRTSDEPYAEQVAAAARAAIEAQS